MIDDAEELNRLLFNDRMVGNDGILKAEAFPMDELLEKNGKSASIDRTVLLQDPEADLKQKLIELSKPEKRRKAWGIAKAIAQEIRNIETQDGRRAFEVFEDKIVVNDPPKCWDNAHAKLVRAENTFTRGLLRGSRDKLVECFSSEVSQIEMP